MGYRGTHAQLEARLDVLRAELAAMHDELAVAGQRVEALREQEWGRLGVLWFRFTLRRALRDVDARGPRHRGSFLGLRKAVERHERALWHAREVLRWLDEAQVAPEPQAATEKEGPKDALRSRLEELRDELSSLHDEIAEASVRVEERRSLEWGGLRMHSFRTSLRNALNDASVADALLDTAVGLRRAVTQHQQAISRAREVLGWLEGYEAPGAAPFRAWAPSDATHATGTTAALAVLGSAARNVWALVLPLLLVVGAVLTIVALARGDDADDFDIDPPDLDEWHPAPMAAGQRHASDVAIGKGLVALMTLSLGAGAGLWWWLQ